MITGLVSKNPLVEKIIDGGISEEIMDLFFKKELPLTEEEYLECLILILKKDGLRSMVISMINNISEIAKSNYIEKKESNHKVAYYILSEALKTENIQIVTKSIRNHFLPIEFLLKIAANGTLSMLEILIENQIKLIAFPEILDAMERNPLINKFIEGKIEEIRAFYLSDEEPEEISEEDVIENIDDIISGKAEIEIEGDEEVDEVFKEKTITKVQRINTLSISERVKLAFMGSKTDRLILIRDPNKVVSQAVLESPKLGKDEIFYYIKNKSTPGAIIAGISRSRHWTRDYQLVIELIQNPKTPIKSSLGFIKKLHLRDLRQVSMDRNINHVVRKLALSLYREKTVGKER